MKHPGRIRDDSGRDQLRQRRSGKTASALSWLDGDVRAGTSTISPAANTVQTIGALNTTIYPRWETVAQSYDASRLGAGKLPLTIAHYEGGFEAIAPTTDDCATIGISSTYGNVVNGSGTITTRGTVQLMLDAYKEHGLFQSAVINQGTQFMNTALVGGEAANHSAVPAGSFYKVSIPIGMADGL